MGQPRNDILTRLRSTIGGWKAEVSAAQAGLTSQIAETNQELQGLFKVLMVRQVKTEELVTAQDEIRRLKKALGETELLPGAVTHYSARLSPTTDGMLREMRMTFERLGSMLERWTAEVTRAHGGLTQQIAQANDQLQTLLSVIGGLETKSLQATPILRPELEMLLVEQEEKLRTLRREKENLATEVEALNTELMDLCAKARRQTDAQERAQDRLQERIRELERALADQLQQLENTQMDREALLTQRVALQDTLAHFEQELASLKAQEQDRLQAMRAMVEEMETYRDAGKKEETRTQELEALLAQTQAQSQALEEQQAGLQKEVSRLESALSQEQEECATLVNRCEELEAALGQSQDSRESAELQMTSQLGTLEESLAKAAEERDTLTTQLGTVEESLALVSEERDALRAQQETLTGKHANLQQEMEDEQQQKTQRILDLEKSTAALQMQLQAISANETQLFAEKERLQQAYDVAQQENAEKETHITQLQEELARLTAVSEELDASNAQLNEKEVALEEAQKRNEALEAGVAEFQQELTTLAEREAERAERNKSLQTMLDALRREAESSANRAKALQEEVETLRAAEQTAAQRAAQWDAREAHCGALEVEKASLEQQLRMTQTQLESLEVEHNEAKRAAETLRRERVHVEAELAQLRQSVEDGSAAERQMKAVQEKLRETEEALSLVQRRNAILEETATQWEKDRERLAKEYAVLQQAQSTALKEQEALQTTLAKTQDEVEDKTTALVALQQEYATEQESRKVLQDVQVALTDERDRMSKQVEELRCATETLSRREEELSATRERLTTQLATEREERLAQQNVLDAAYAELEELRTSQAQCATLQEELLQERERVWGQAQQLLSLQKTFSVVEEQRAQLKMAVEENSAAAQEQRTYSELLEKDGAKKETALRALQEEMNALQTQYAEEKTLLTARTERLAALEDECAAQKIRLAEQEEMQRTLQAEKEALDAQCLELAQGADEAQKALTELQERHACLEADYASLQQTETQLRQTEEDLRTRVDALGERAQTQSENLQNSWRHIEMLAALRELHTSLKTRLQERDEQLASANASKETLCAELDAAQVALQTMREKCGHLEESNTDTQRALEILEQRAQVQTENLAESWRHVEILGALRMDYAAQETLLLEQEKSLQEERTQRDALAQELESVQAAFARLQEEQNSRKKALQDQDALLNQLESQREESQRALEALQGALDKEQAEKEAAYTQHKQIEEQLTETLSTSQVQAENLQNAWQHIEILGTLRMDYAAQEALLLEQEKTLAGEKTRRDALLYELESVRNAFAQLEAEQATLQQSHEEATRELALLIQTNQVHQANLKESWRHIEILSRLKGSQTEQQALLQERTQQREAARSYAEGLMREKEALEKDLFVLKARETEWAQEQAALQEAVCALEKTQAVHCVNLETAWAHVAELAALREWADSHRKERTALEETLSERCAEAENMAQRIHALEEELAELLNQQKDQQVETTAIRERKDSLQEELEQTRKDLVAAQALAQKHEQAWHNAQAKIEAMASETQRIKAVGTELEASEEEAKQHIVTLSQRLESLQEADAEARKALAEKAQLLEAAQEHTAALEHQLSDLSAAHWEAEIQRNALAERDELLQTLKAEQQDTKTQNETLKKTVDTLQARLDLLQAEISTLEQQKKEAHTHHGKLSLELATVRDKVRMRDELTTSLRNDLAQSHAQLAFVEQELDQQKRHCATLKVQLEQMQAREKTAHSLQKRMEEERVALETQVQSLEGEKEKGGRLIHEARSAITAQKKALEERENAVTSLREQVESLQVQLEEVQRKEAKTARTAKEMQSALHAFKSTQAPQEQELAQSREAVQLLRVELQEQETAMEKLVTERTALQRHLDAIREDRDNSASLAERLQEQLAEMRTTKASERKLVDQARKAVATHHDELARRDTAVAQLEAEMATLEERLDAARAETTEHREKVARTAAMMNEALHERDEALQQLRTLHAEQGRVRVAPVSLTPGSEAAHIRETLNTQQRILTSQLLQDEIQPLGEVLVSAGVLSEKQLRRALKKKKRAPSKRLGEILVEMEYATEDAIAQSLACQLQLQLARPNAATVDGVARDLLNKELCSRFLVAPIQATLDRLVVAMADPLDESALKKMADLTRREIVPVVATPGDILATIDDVYGIY